MGLVGSLNFCSFLQMLPCPLTSTSHSPLSPAQPVSGLSAAPLWAIHTFTFLPLPSSTCNCPVNFPETVLSLLVFDNFSHTAYRKNWDPRSRSNDLSKLRASLLMPYSSTEFSSIKLALEPSLWAFKSWALVILRPSRDGKELACGRWFHLLHPASTHSSRLSPGIFLIKNELLPET